MIDERRARHELGEELTRKLGTPAEFAVTTIPSSTTSMPARTARVSSGVGRHVRH
ncbi:MAG TPA: hypothetical protein VGK49_00250 [Ilumatobacteraceae bacterium]